MCQKCAQETVQHALWTPSSPKATFALSQTSHVIVAPCVMVGISPVLHLLLCHVLVLLLIVFVLFGFSFSLTSYQLIVEMKSVILQKHVVVVIRIVTILVVSQNLDS